jgi:hypothetical protein
MPAPHPPAAGENGSPFHCPMNDHVHNENHPDSDSRATMITSFEWDGQQRRD